MEQTKLKSTRLKLGLSHKDVAEHAGISRCFYTQIENGTRKPSLDIALKISNVLGIPVNDIFLVNNDASGNNAPVQPTGTEGSR